MKKRINWKVLFGCFFVVFLVAAIGSMFTSESVNGAWYLDNKPSFTPPNWVFGPAWTIIYILIAFSLYFSWTNANLKQKRKMRMFFGVNLLANLLWSWLFFGLQNPFLAFIDIIIILGTIVAMIFIVWKIEKKSVWFLMPYLLWVCFATVLNFAFLL